MPKSQLTRGARRTADEQASQWSNAVEGQLTELCRELAVEAKRMQRLLEQADELRTAIYQWVDQSDPRGARAGQPASRAGRR